MANYGVTFLWTFLWTFIFGSFFGHSFIRTVRRFFLSSIFREMNNKPIYNCIKCNFKCSKLSDWKRHSFTRKHIEDDKMDDKTPKKIALENKIAKKKTVTLEKTSLNNDDEHLCSCGKKYKYRQGLFKHKKTCFNDHNNNNKNPHYHEEIEISSEIILQLMKENKDLKHLLQEHKNQTDTILQQNSTLIELAKNNQLSSNYSNNTNCNNKTFNLNFFLNETCKNALNINDFVDSIKLQLTDLENVGKLGFINGITNIIVKNLNALNETQRPVHCTDRKRKTIYVKDEDKWEKEDAECKKVRKAIKHVANKNSKLLFEFKEMHPDCIDGDSKHSDQYSKLMVEAYGGANQEDAENENKIINNILKVVTIDK